MLIPTSTALSAAFLFYTLIHHALAVTLEQLQAGAQAIQACQERDEIFKYMSTAYTALSSASTYIQLATNADVFVMLNTLAGNKYMTIDQTIEANASKDIICDAFNRAANAANTIAAKALWASDRAMQALASISSANVQEAQVVSSKAFVMAFQSNPFLIGVKELQMARQARLDAQHALERVEEELKTASIEAGVLKRMADQVSTDISTIKSQLNLG